MTQTGSKHHATTEQLWVAVVDASYARLFSVTLGAQHPIDRPPRLAEFETLAHPEGRLPRRALGEEQGATSPSGGRGVTHATNQDNDPKEAELERFARDVGHRLNHGRAEGHFAKLAVLAAPEMLGLLRKHLDDATRRTVVAEVGKHLGHAPADEVRAALPAALFA